MFCESFYLQPLGEAVPYREKKRLSKAERKAAAKVGAAGQKVVEEEKKEETPAANKPMRLRTAMSKVPSACGSCGSQLTIGGPIWNKPIHNVSFAKRLLARLERDDCTLKTKGRIQGLMGGIVDEEPLQDYPLNFNLHDVCSTIRAQNPRKEQIHAAFESLNFNLCQTYYNGDLWKTDAPPEAVYDIFKKFKQHISPDKYVSNLPATSPARTMVEKALTYEADLEYQRPEKEAEGGEEGAEGAKAGAGNKRLLRKYFTPTVANWGPLSRATGGKKQAKAAADDTPLDK